MKRTGTAVIAGLEYAWPFASYPTAGFSNMMSVRDMILGTGRLVAEGLDVDSRCATRFDGPAKPFVQEHGEAIP